MPCLAPGMSFGYSAIVLDQLELTVNEQSWFGIYFNFFYIILLKVVCLPYSKTLKNAITINNEFTL